MLVFESLIKLGIVFYVYNNSIKKIEVGGLISV